MTAKQIECITALRERNYSYSFIGCVLKIPANTVKSVCRRKGIKATGSRKTKAEKAEATLCRYCHMPLPENLRKDALFCSDYCRTKWRRENIKISEKRY